MSPFTSLAVFLRLPGSQQLILKRVCIVTFCSLLTGVMANQLRSAESSPLMVEQEPTLDDENIPPAPSIDTLIVPEVADQAADEKTEDKVAEETLIEEQKQQAEPVSEPVVSQESVDDKSVSQESTRDEGEKNVAPEEQPLEEELKEEATEEEEWVVAIIPMEKPQSPLTSIRMMSYEEAYRSVPYRQTEYLANPGYRHDAAMEFAFDQMRPTVINRNDIPQRIVNPQPHPYIPYQGGWRRFDSGRQLRSWDDPVIRPMGYSY